MLTRGDMKLQESLDQRGANQGWTINLKLIDEEVSGIPMSSAAAASFLSLLPLAAEFFLVMAARGAHAARIPEHTCYKLISFHKCSPQKCIDVCFKEVYGVGKCRSDGLCFCTYYCKLPPQ
ncbi:hypothetical protein NL676_016758 [Syzygium grande]|nr:hypothetical protein NL676_016758 [Syzygium grande]